MKFLLFGIFSSLFAFPAVAQNTFETDIIKTDEGDVKIVFIGHGSLLMKFKGKSIYVDPYSKLTDYASLPKADVLLITHEHQDHLDTAAIGKIRTKDTVVILTAECAGKVDGGIVMKNGDEKTVEGIRIEAVPAYNLVHHRDNGQPFHPKGRGNGYVLNMGAKRVYIAGDTENTPEMKALRSIDVAFLPMNLPYTMTPEMVADAAKSFSPKVLYPYHFGDTDTSRMVSLLKDDKDIVIRIRKMK